MEDSSEKDLIIVGGGGFALEVCWLAERVGYRIVGFLVDDCNSKELLGRKVLGGIEAWENFQEKKFVIAVGSPRGRKFIFSRMTSKLIKPEFVTLIDPAAILGPNVVFGIGSIVCAGVVATIEINAGEHVIVNLNSTIGHETSIGNFVTIAPLVAVSGKVKIADMVEIGTGAVIRERLRLSSGAMLGMGGVLTKDIPENSLFVGNPAKFIKNI